MYALNVAQDGAVLSATKDEFGVDGQPRIDVLPDGDITLYDYKNGKMEPNAERVAVAAAAANIPPPPSDAERLTAVEAALLELAMGGVLDG